MFSLMKLSFLWEERSDKDTNYVAEVLRYVCISQDTELVVTWLKCFHGNETSILNAFCTMLQKQFSQTPL